MTSAGSELASCPFCGGVNIRVRYDRDDPEYTFAECDICQTQGPVVISSVPDTKARAIARWNTRPSVAEADNAGLVERLRKDWDSYRIYPGDEKLLEEVCAALSDKGSEARDAARYRWLREREGFDGFGWYVLAGSVRGIESRERLDSAIDSAMKGQAHE